MADYDSINFKKHAGLKLKPLQVPVEKQKEVDSMEVAVDLAMGYGADMPDEKWSAEEQTEYMMRAVLRLKLQGATKLQIRHALCISERQVNIAYENLTMQFRSEVEDMDVGSFVGQALNFYDMVRSDCVAMAMKPGQEAADRLHSYRTALMAENHKHNFLTRAGLYKAPTTGQIFEDTGQEIHSTDATDFQKFLQVAALEIEENNASTE